MEEAVVTSGRFRCSHSSPLLPETMLAVASQSVRIGALDRIDSGRVRLNVMAKRSSMLEANEGRKLIVGLGNPGKQFHGTRHNVGFTIIDHLAELHGISMTKTKFNSIYGSTNPVSLVSPAVAHSDLCLHLKLGP